MFLLSIFIEPLLILTLKLPCSLIVETYDLVKISKNNIQKQADLGEWKACPTTIYIAFYLFIFLFCRHVAINEEAKIVWNLLLTKSVKSCVSNFCDQNSLGSF